MLSAGDTFLLASEIGGIEHLWIIVLDHDPSGSTIIVNATTKRAHHIDLTVILRVGDHPFITQDSIILYEESKISDVAGIKEGMKIGLVKPYPSRCTPEILAKIKRGLLDSEFTPRKVKNFYRKQVK